MTTNELNEKNLLAKAWYYLALAERADKGEIGFREADPALDMGYHGFLLAKLVVDTFDPQPEPEVEEKKETCFCCGDQDCIGRYNYPDCPDYEHLDSWEKADLEVQWESEQRGW